MIKELLEGTKQPEGDLQTYLVSTAKRAKDQLVKVSEDLKKLEEQQKNMQALYYQLVGVYNLMISDLEAKL